MPNWLKDENWDEKSELEHVDGVPWIDAPLPRKWHKCKPQTRGWSSLTRIERCACGSTRLNSEGPWLHKNERRK